MRYQVWAERNFVSRDIAALKASGHYDPNADEDLTFSLAVLLCDGSMCITLSKITPPIRDIRLARGIVKRAIEDALNVDEVKVSFVGN